MTTPDPAARPAPPGTAPAGAPAPGTPAPAPAAPGALAPAPTPPRRARRRARGVGFTLAGALLVAVTVLLVLFVVFNTRSVRISLVFVDIEAPLVLALVIAAVLGGLIVALTAMVRRARRSKA